MKLMSVKQQFHRNKSGARHTVPDAQTTTNISPKVTKVLKINRLGSKLCGTKNAVPIMTFAE
jgi:hypothetical protein